MASLIKENSTVEKLKNYQGKNPYILMLKKNVLLEHKFEVLNDFNIKYIDENYDVVPLPINKVVNIDAWLGQKLKEKFGCEFTPEKLKIISYLGKIDNLYHCLIQYRQSVPPSMQFLNTKSILNNFFVTDYNDLDIDFTPFDNALKKVNKSFSVMPHQKKSVKFLLNRKKCILSLDMGLGKTTTSIIASLVYPNKKVLVVTPASIKTNWKNELERFVDPDDISLIKSTDEMNKQELIEFLNLKPDCNLKKDELLKYAKAHGKWSAGKRFTIVNFDIIDEFHQIPASRKKVDIDECLKNSDLIKEHFDIVIIDEAHKLSQNTSIRYKVLRDYLKKANNEYVWLLTGTMVTNNAKNLYNMISLVEDEITKDYNYFMNTYCGGKQILKKGEWDRCWRMWNKGRYASYDILSPLVKKNFRDFVDKVGKKITLTNESTNLEELSQKINHLYFKMDKDDIMKDLKKVIIPVEYEMNLLQKAEYDRVWDEYKETSDNENIDDVKQLVEVSLYRQYISKIMLPKTVELANKILSEGKKVFIVCSYDDEVYSLKDLFGDKAVIYNGKMNQKKKDEAVELFNNDDNITVFIGQIIACGVGINLNKSCHTAIFQNLDFTDAAFSQACDRIFRIGNTHDAEIYLQYYKDTIYEHMYDIIEKKRNITNTLIKKEDER